MKLAHFACFFALTCAIAAAQSNPIPFLNNPPLPSATMPGGTSFSLTINGTGFVPSSTVQWNGTPLTTTFVSNSRLTATVPASDIASPGTASMSVLSPPPGGGTSNLLFFHIALPVPYLDFTSLTPTTGGTSSAVTAADLNGDGKLDLVEFGNGMAIQLGNGDGTFQSPVSYDAGITLNAPIFGDFNGDGKLDVAAIQGTNVQSGVVIFFGNGDGTFQVARALGTVSVTFALTVGDFNADGKLDLALVCNSGQCSGSGGPTPATIAIFLGNGDGTFQNEVDYTPTVWQQLNYLVNSSSLATGDFNGDGKLDIAFSGGRDGGILQGNGDGTFAFIDSVNTPNGTDIFAADLNGDGKIDLVDLPCYAFLGNGDGTFQSPIQSGAPGNCWGGNILGDVNADGFLDLTSIGKLIQFALGNGDGTFQNPGGLGGFPASGAVTTGDFNGDGLVDVAVLNGNPSQLGIWLQKLDPWLYAFPSSLTFGAQQVGTTSSPQMVRLTNNDTVALTLSSISIGGNSSAFAQTNNCPSSLAMNASCQVQVAFTPTQLGNSISGSLIVANSGPVNPIMINLIGSTTLPGISLSPAGSLSFTQYLGATSLNQNVTVKNTGTATLAINSVNAAPSEFGVVNSCGTILAAGSTCNIGVSFTPSTTATISGTLTVNDNAANSPQTLTLTGTGSDFSLATSSPVSITVTPGQTANFSLSVVPSYGFNQPVSLNCSGAPTQSTCTLSPNSVTLDGTNAATVNVAVITNASSASLMPRGKFPLRNIPAIWLATFGVFGLAVIAKGRRRGRAVYRKLFYSITFLCAASLTITFLGCGGGSASSRGNSSTPVGTYNLKVTGTFSSGSSKLSHDMGFTLVVQNP